MTDKLSEYEIDDGVGGSYTVQLSAADAKARGLTAKRADKPAEPPDAAPGTDDTGTDAKAVTPANKRRHASNK